jgi:hypothetical protein
MERPKESKPIVTVPIHQVVKIVRKIRRLWREPEETDTIPPEPLKPE